MESNQLKKPILLLLKKESIEKFKNSLLLIVGYSRLGSVNKRLEETHRDSIP